MLILKTENNERKMKKRHRRVRSNVTVTGCLETNNHCKCVSSKNGPSPFLEEAVLGASLSHGSEKTPSKLFSLQTRGDALSSGSSQLPRASWLHCSGFKLLLNSWIIIVVSLNSTIPLFT